MSGRSLTIEQILTLLAAGPPRIASLIAGLSESQLRTSNGAGEWPASGVLAHLRACADVWGNSIGAILAEDEPTVRASDPRVWIKTTGYLDLEFQTSLHAFAAQRSTLLAILKALPTADWTRSATVKGAGKVLKRTVQYYAQLLRASSHRADRAHADRDAFVVGDRYGPVLLASASNPAFGISLVVNERPVGRPRLV